LKYLNNNPIVVTSFADSIGKALVGQVYYAVSAVDTLGNISELSKMVMALIPDFTAPSIPFIKRITPKDKALVVEFMENVDADLKEFILLKNTSKDSSRISLAPDATEYTDKDVVPGTEYTYTMLAQDLSGNWSAISGAYTMVAEGVDESMLMPIMPKSISAKYNKSKKIIEIAWSQLFNDDNLGAAIYKGETNDELALISPMLRTGAYDDKRVKAGNTYYYQIRTYAANGLKHQSELISVTIKEDKK
jgi:fibronectin type 3 domain-containing protein